MPISPIIWNKAVNTVTIANKPNSLGAIKRERNAEIMVDMIIPEYLPKAVYKTPDISSRFVPISLITQLKFSEISAFG